MKSIVTMFMSVLLLVGVSVLIDVQIQAQPKDASVSVDASIDPSSLPSKIGVHNEPKDVPEAVVTGKGIFKSFKDGKYREAVAGIILVLMFIWRRFLSSFVIGKLSKWWLGFITVLLSFLGTIPEALAAEPFKWYTFVWSACLMSAEAMFMWQMILKKIPWFKIPDEKKKEITVPGDAV